MNPTPTQPANQVTSIPYPAPITGHSNACRSESYKECKRGLVVIKVVVSMKRAAGRMQGVLKTPTKLRICLQLINKLDINDCV